MNLWKKIFGDETDGAVVIERSIEPITIKELSVIAVENASADIVAVISASLAAILTDVDDEAVTAAIVAAIAHHSSGCKAVSIERATNQWAIYGRQQLMNDRLAMFG